jgi:hypothetical protein
MVFIHDDAENDNTETEGNDTEDCYLAEQRNSSSLICNADDGGASEEKNVTVTHNQGWGITNLEIGK